MGLTIHYTLSLKENISPDVIRELVRRTAHYAQKIGCAEVGELLRVKRNQDLAPLFFRVGKLSIESPIFDYKNFERLEHEGWQEFGARIKQLRGKLSELK